MQNSNTITSTNSLLANVKHAVVVGLGDSGTSCLRYLDSKNIDLTAMDSRQSPPRFEEIKSNYSNVRFINGKFDAQLLLDTDLVVLSPGVSLKTAEISAAREAGVPIVGDIELFAHEATSSVISITGSNGKSTVTALCGEMLKFAGVDAGVGGNFGVPALDLLNQPASVYVLELSSFQLETTRNLNSKAAVILNITPDHMDRYASFDDYCTAKQQIFKNASSVVYNRNDLRTKPSTSSFENLISFGADEPQTGEDFGVRDVGSTQWLCQGEQNLIGVDQLQLKGVHNQLNVQAALALLYIVGVKFDKAKDGLLQFSGLPHRFEFIGEWDGIEWINDSKGTNPGATLASISGQNKPIVLIAGGDAKGADFSILTQALRSHVKAVVLFGRDSGCIEEILPVELTRVKAQDLIEAVQQAQTLSTKDDMVLFSPACASFDMFDNYIERGDAFKNTVRGYFG